MSSSDSAASSSKKGKAVKGGRRSKLKEILSLRGKKEPITTSAGPTGQSNDTSGQPQSVQASLQAIKQPPKDKPGPIQELWNEAYEALRIQDEGLINDYEGCLRGDLATMIDSTLSTSLSGFKTQRMEQMRALLVRKVEQANNNTWKLRFAGQETAVKDLAKPLVGIIQFVAPNSPIPIH